MVEKEGYNVIIDICNCFDQPVKNEIRTYDNIRKHCYLRKLITIDLTKQQALDTDPKISTAN